MVNHLELETPMEPVEPLGSTDIHRGAKSLGGEVFLTLHILGIHTVVRDVDLQVQDGGSEVRNQHEEHCLPSVGERGTTQTYVPGGEDHHTTGFHASPSTGLWLVALDDEGP